MSRSKLPEGLRPSIVLASLITGLLVSSGEPASAVSIYTFQTLDAPDAVLTDAIGINGAGQIVGYYFDVSNNIHSFLFSDGIYTPIEVPGASFTQASGINDAGRIVGFYGDTNQRGHGFLRSDNDIDRL